MRVGISKQFFGPTWFGSVAITGSGTDFRYNHFLLYYRIVQGRTESVRIGFVTEDPVLG